MSQLPSESATATALRLQAHDDPPAAPAEPHDPEIEQWSRDQQLMALIRDELHAIRWLYSSAHSEQGKGPKWTPDPLPRPGVTPEPKRPALSPEQAAALAQHLALTQGEDVAYN